MSSEQETTPRKQQSSVWSFFDRTGTGSSKCHTCGCVLMTPTSTTTPLINHLKRHPAAHKEYSSRIAATTTTPASKNAGSRQTTSLCTGFLPQLSANSTRSRELAMKIGSFIASGLHSFSIVEERGFVALMKCAVPNFTVPSRTTFSRSVVPELYSATRHAVYEKLQSILRTCAASIAITTNGWTSRAGDSFVAVTCHVLSEEFEPHNFVLACRSLRESHTASNLRSLLQGIFMDWGISDNLPCFVVTDNARNFVSAIRQAPWVRISCFAHTVKAG